MRCLVSSEYLQKTDRSCDWAIKEFSAHLGKGGFSAFCLEGVFPDRILVQKGGEREGGPDCCELYNEPCIGGII